MCLYKNKSQNYGQMNLNQSYATYHVLIYQMPNKSSSRNANSLIISLKPSSELNNQPSKNKLTNLRKFRVDNCYECSVHMGEGWRGRLSLHKCFSKQTPK